MNPFKQSFTKIASCASDPSQPVGVESSLILLPFGEPIGCIALTHLELHNSQARARELFPVERTPNAPPSRALLDAKEAARILKVDSSWLLRAARERRIPFVQIGKYVRFDPQELISRFHVTPTQTGPSAGG